jgi:hypothetical protein
MGRRQRARTEPSGTWEARSGVQRGPPLAGSHNRPWGWANYFGLGYPRQTFRHLNHFVRYRLGMHLRRRSQRGWRAREGVSLYAHLDHLGLVSL